MIEETIKLFAKSCGPHHYSSFGFPHRAEVTELLPKGGIQTITRQGKLRIAYEVKVLKSDSTQKDFRGEDIHIPKGTVIVPYVAVDASANSNDFQIFRTELEAFKEQPAKQGFGIFKASDNNNILVEIYVESPGQRRLVEYLGYNCIATKIMAGSEIRSLYAPGQISHHCPLVQKPDIPALAEIDPRFLSTGGLKIIREELSIYLNSQRKAWENHYSIYNTKNKWAAFAIKGFKKDPSFIIKPSEMSKTWKAEHPKEMRLTETFFTDAYNYFLGTYDIINDLIPGKYERVRFMRLAADGGILKRHADITDRFAGTADNRVTRLHIPIYTNNQVIIRGWELSGQKIEMTWQPGGLYYLDQRKPHEVENNSTEDRIHLVVDCFGNDIIRDWIAESING